ncbi:MAG: hypothetical protein EXQ50_00825 [Acidobacteria bacterium]|nr:hypothetical protein [Acidobacteriota bacterium]
MPRILPQGSGIGDRGSGIGDRGSGRDHVRHEEHGLRFVYMPTVPRHTARKSALNHLVDTFFDGSHAKVVTTLLGSDPSRLSDDDLDRIAELIATARKAGR